MLSQPLFVGFLRSGQQSKHTSDFISVSSFHRSSFSFYSSLGRSYLAPEKEHHGGIRASSQHALRMLRPYFDEDLVCKTVSHNSLYHYQFVFNFDIFINCYIFSFSEALPFIYIRDIKLPSLFISQLFILFHFL